MSSLIAQGNEPSERWRRQLPVNQPVIVGRTIGWTVPWDDCISRAHVELAWDDHSLQVRKLPQATNPLFFHGQSVTHASLQPDEHFVIGSTTFTLASQRALPTIAAPAPLREVAFSRDELRGLRVRLADERIELLSKLPEQLAAAVGDTAQLSVVVNLLMAAMPRAATIAIVGLDDERDGAPPIILHWDQRQSRQADFFPSARLIRAALTAGNSILHVWDRAALDQQFTMQAGVDWAFCTPVRTEKHRIGLYVSGSRTQAAGGSAAIDDMIAVDEEFGTDLKFAELVASFLASVRQVQQLERQRAGLGQFFSPIVLDALADADAERVLAPRQAQVSVLFCDLRGFSRAAEESAADLFALLNRVSQTLGVATRQICGHGGVLGDFHGDAVMGFWGWPLATADDVLCAARTALAIRAELAEVIQHGTETAAVAARRFRAGIGIGTGLAVAGKIGTADQVKVTAFGPVVNVAARLESLTAQLQTPILLDEPTAALLARKLSPDLGRLRRIARVLPVGMLQPLMVYELLPPATEMQVTDADLAAYELALDHFLQGDWQAAWKQLQAVPTLDRAKEFLATHIAQHGQAAPANWPGYIKLANK